MVEILLKAENVSRILKTEVHPVSLVRDANLQVHAGEFVAITGPSGSGKSSLLYLLGLLDIPSSGRIWLRGVDMSGLSHDDLAQLRLSEMGFVFQFHFLLPEFSSLENVMLPMQRLGRLSASQIRARAETILEDLGLSEHRFKLPSQLSGGQRQRAAIGRALANDPALILADEPTGNLDTASSQNVQAILRKLAHEQSRAIIAVTHEPPLAASADRIITIVDGQIKEN